MEFEPGDSEPPSGASRRQFLQLMGAAMAMAGLTGCRRPAEKILPYARKPEDVIPGIPQNYATAMPFRGTVRPILVESHEGRPTKVEGNPDHPIAQSGTSPYEQASILNLYDPDRSATVRRDGGEASWSDFISFCRQLADNAAEKQIAVLIEETSSPTVQAMRDRIEGRFPNLRWIPYASSGDDAQRQGMEQAFGRPLRPQYNLGEAEVILSLDADFLSGAHRDFYHNTKAFAEGRRLEEAEDDMSRLYTIESRYTETGGISDHRMRMKAGRIPAFAAAIASELDVGGAPSAQWSEKEQLYAREIANDLREAGAQGIVVAGDGQPPEVHALAMAINDQIGSIGSAVTLYDTGDTTTPSQDEQLRDLVDAIDAGQIDALFCVGVNPVYDAPAELNMQQALRQVSETVHVGLLRDETAQACRWHVPRAHYLEAWGDGRAYDGTLSVIQPLIAPLYDDAHSEIEVLNALATGMDAAGYDLVRQQWREQIADDFEDTWRRALHDGYLADTQYPATTASVQSVPSVAAPADDGLEVVVRLDPTLLDGRFSNNAWMQELPDPITKIVWDNVAIMSRSTADELGVERRYDSGNFYVDRVDLTVNGQTVNLPVWVQPGHPDGSITVMMGYGRSIATTRGTRSTPFWDTDDYTDIYGDGPIAGGVNDGSGDGSASVGTNVAPLRPLGAQRATGASVTKTGSGYLIASTQEEGSMQGRPIVRWATLDEFRENPDFVEDDESYVPKLDHDGGEGHDAEGDVPQAGHGGDGQAPDEEGSQEGPPVLDDVQESMEDHGDGEGGGFQEYPTMWEDNHPREQQATKDNPYFENQWGMVIDLNTCTGCNACVVACTSENNVQVVGKEEVSEGRHMYWIRNDRYYVSTEGNEDDPEMMTQPVMCQHCENAPCESVCPVAATVHSPDGTNQMIYNRCIGTRYCSNNCPYKVRRFNFYNWTKTLPAEVQMAQNPKVSVRSRGVMEKCSWCIHRVRESQRQADNEDRDLRPNEIETACQQACPTDAITFGDLNNPDSDVVRQKRNPRRYELLSYLNVKPRLSYLGRVRNTNPRIREYEESTDAEAAPA
jgi:molybdopterin-containing oxidoreductase family iron-sulfur binding subunit